jgi:hypothetical protein
LSNRSLCCALLFPSRQLRSRFPNFTSQTLLLKLYFSNSTSQTLLLKLCFSNFTSQSCSPNPVCFHQYGGSLPLDQFSALRSGRPILPDSHTPVKSCQPLIPF